MKIIEEHIVTNLDIKERLSSYAIGIFSTIHSRKALSKTIKEGNILLNGKVGRTGDWVKSSDKIELVESARKAPKPYIHELEIVFEDDYLAIVNKPAGIEVNGNKFKTIENIALSHLKINTSSDGLIKPHPAHRLDKPTSGLLIIGKTAQALINISHQFEERTIQKTYHAIAIGHLPLTGTIDFPVDNLPSKSTYKSLQYQKSLRSEELTLVELSPHTGRKHQLRKHLQELGFPILGDKLYGKEGYILEGKGLFLAATKITFNHPITGEKITISIPLPTKFNTYLEREERRYNKYFG